MATKPAEQFPSAHKQLLKRWEDVKAAAAKLQAEERELRDKIVEMVTDPQKKSGTINFDLGNGYKCKIVKGLRYNLDKDGVNDALDAIERTGPEGKLISDRLVKFEPRLSITEYNQLPLNMKAIIDKVITISDASPTVEIVAPDSKKVR